MTVRVLSDEQLHDLVVGAIDAGDTHAWRILNIARFSLIGPQRAPAMVLAIAAWASRCARTGGRPWILHDEVNRRPAARRPCPGCAACAAQAEPAPAEPACFVDASPDPEPVGHDDVTAPFSREETP